MNKHEVLWFAIFAVFAIVLGILLIGGGIAMFLAPRMHAVAWFGFAAMSALTVYQGYRTMNSEKESKNIRLHGIVFLIPIVLLLTVAPNDATSSTLTNYSLALPGRTMVEAASGATAEAPVQDTPVPNATQAAQEITGADMSKPIESPEQEDEMEPQVVISDVESLSPCVLSEGTLDYDTTNDALFHEYIYMSLEELMNEQLTLAGFVFKDPSFPEDTILVSRLMISCCIADASVVGFHVRVEDGDDYEDGEWIIAKGTAQAISLQMDEADYNFPVLTGGTVTRCEAPAAEDAYLYP